MSIVTFDNHPDLRPQLEAIFFSSAHKQTFASDLERREFRRKWLDLYLDEAPKYTLLYLSEDGQAIGYLVGWLNSQEKMWLFSDISYYATLTDYYRTYPAHFHINVLDTYRNKGLGTELVAAFIRLCNDMNLTGIHVITNSCSRNRSFYRRCKFYPAYEFSHNKKNLVLLGRRL